MDPGDGGPTAAGPAAPQFISTGSLPTPDRIRALLRDVHQRFRPVTDGAVSSVYPALQQASPELWGLSLMGTDGSNYAVGDASTLFPLMSVAKPFTFALLCEAVGVDQARRQIGANATGLPFNSVAAVERSPDGRTNPMVNAGAIATVGALPAGSAEDRWEQLLDGLSRFAGRRLEVDEATYRSASSSNFRNRSIAVLLRSVDALQADPAEAVDIYTRVSCLAVTANDLAAMGAVLADGGVNPATGERLLGLPTCRAVLTVMMTAGLYETSGDWLYDIGLPGKSGIGGGIVTVSPGKGALGTFAPPLDAAGNSVRGQLAARYLSRTLGLDLFASADARIATAAGGTIPA
ncbi:glutaminase A [Nakamurella lactea]|uniref:glutaminase A n=1 Tax=Nakamurella lactea TaxID=459515 RepID=UPI0003FCF366